MNVHLGTILEEELDLLNAAVNICGPSEVDGEGIAQGHTQVSQHLALSTR